MREHSPVYRRDRLPRDGRRHDRLRGARVRLKLSPVTLGLFGKRVLSGQASAKGKKPKVGRFRGLQEVLKGIRRAMEDRPTVLERV